jgi:hypothetical protein
MNKTHKKPGGCHGVTVTVRLGAHRDRDRDKVTVTKPKRTRIFNMRVNLEVEQLQVLKLQFYTRFQLGHGVRDDSDTQAPTRSQPETPSPCTRGRRRFKSR